MNLLGGLKMIWNKITGKDVSPDVMAAEARIEEWRAIYRGSPEWLDYWYPTLKGKLQKRVRKTMRPAKLVCSELAGLVWAETPKLAAPQGVLDVLAAARFMERIQAETDLMLALGATIFKLYVSDGKIGIDFVQPDRFIPVSWDAGVITEADIIDRRVIDKKQYVRIERHRKEGDGYKITSEVFEQRGSELYPAPISLFGLKESEATSPVKMFFYCGNPEANNLDTDSPLSISIFENARDTLECLDIAFDALNSEIVLGKKRIIVPARALRHVIVTDPNSQSVGKPERYFDPSDEVYQAFDTDDKENLKITDNTVELRIEEIRMAIQTLLDILAVQIGLSVGTFSFDGVSMKTATEVISENSKTFKTKKNIENEIGRAIVAMMESIAGLLVYTGQGVGQDPISIEWDDSVIEDRNSKTAYVQSRLTGGTLPRYRAIMMLDGVDEAEARTRAAEIAEENKTVDVSTMFGGIG
jgi:A118 family predicted phage portal protein